MKIAILGTEDLERSQLAQALRQALSAEPASAEGLVISDIPSALAAIHPNGPLRSHDLILLMAADGATQQDGQLRETLQRDGLHFTVLYGNGQTRIDSALQTIRHALNLPTQEITPPGSWRWNCEKCSDPECEHRLFSALLANASMRP